MNTHRVKALRITLRDAKLQQHRRELDASQFVQVNMWLPKHAFFLHTEYHTWPHRFSILYVQLPSTHMFGRLAKSTARFLELWMREALVLHYEEGWLETGSGYTNFDVIINVEPHARLANSTIALQ